MTMTEILCANAIANLEGWKGIPLVDPSSATTLEVLDYRVIRLEKAFHSPTPAPTSEPSWESLAYRIRRMQKWFQSGKKLPDSGFKPFTTFKDAESQTLALKRILAKISTAPLDWPEELDEKKFLAIASQHLCHVAGSLLLKIANPPETLTQTYLLAIDISLESESRGHRLGPSFPPGMYPPSHYGAGRPMGISNPKSCCGCCGCSCHNQKDQAKVPPGVRVVDARRPEDKRPSPVRRFFKLSWLKTLGCRRSKVIYDSYSSASDDIVD